MSPEHKALAVAYVEEKYCYGSDCDIETDAIDKDEDFSKGEDGVWVRGWLFVPKSVFGEGEDEDEDDEAADQETPS